jgi:hypothetical protein
VSVVRLDPLSDLLDRQNGVLRVEQAFIHRSRGEVRWLLTSGRWQRPYPRILVAQTGPLTRRQEIWAALLHCGNAAVLAGPTGAEVDGLRGYEEHRIRVLVPHGGRLRVDADGRFPTDRIRLRQCRDLGPAFVHPARQPVRTRLERSVLDMASEHQRVDDAVAVLAASVQQRLTSVPRLRGVLGLLANLPQRTLLAQTLGDIAGGAQSLPEVSFGRLLRHAGLPPPTRQAVLRRGDGRYYLDAEWQPQRVAAEIDGLSHLEVSRWLADLERQNALAVGRLTVVRFASFHIRHRPAYVVQTLRALGL